MKTITNQELADWCRKRGLDVDSHLRVFSLKKRRVFDITKVSPAQAVYIGYALVIEGKAGDEDERTDSFHGGLVWISSWEVGDYPVAIKMVERARMSYGVTGWPMDTPGHHFDQNEELDAAMFVTFLLLFHWEGYFIAEDGGYMFWVDDDEAIVLAGADERCDDIIAVLKKYYTVVEASPETKWYNFICAE